MKNWIPIIFFLSCLSSCCENKKGLFYVIPPFKCPNSTECYPILYGHHNFIIYDDSTIYYHDDSKRLKGRCGTGLDGSKPQYLGLVPKDLIQIREIHPFLKSLSLEERGRRTFVQIISLKDTIRNLNYWPIKKFFMNKEFVLLGTSKPTEEQEQVANARFKKTSYDPSKIHWKIGFDDGLTPPTAKTLRFLPPVNE